MPPKPKLVKKPTKKLTQKERFIEAARAAEADESGETFKKAVKKIFSKVEKTK